MTGERGPEPSRPHFTSPLLDSNRSVARRVINPTFRICPAALSKCGSIGLTLRCGSLGVHGVVTDDHRNASIAIGNLNFAVDAAFCMTIGNGGSLRVTTRRPPHRGAENRLLFVRRNCLPLTDPLRRRWRRWLLVSCAWYRNACLPALTLLRVLTWRAPAFRMRYE